jgi:hypothetical protein
VSSSVSCVSGGDDPTATLVVDMESASRHD